MVPSTILGHVPIRRSFIEEVQRIMRSIHHSPHNLLGLEVFQLLVRASVIPLRCVRGALWPSQRLRPPNRPSRCQRRSRLNRRIREHLCRSSRRRDAYRGLSNRGGGGAVYHLPPVARYVVVAELVAVQTISAAIVGLPLPPRRREEALLALPSTSHARRVAWVVDAAQVALDLAPPTRDAGLVDAFVLERLPIDRGRAIGFFSAVWALLVL